MTILQLKHLILLRNPSVLALPFCIAFITIADGQSLTSRTATWSTNLPSNVQTIPPYGQPCLTGDVYGSGTTDLVCITQYEGTVPSAISVLESTKGASSGFNATTVNGTINPDSSGAPASACALGDFDGDGRDDLACFIPLVGGNQNWPTVWFSTSIPFSLNVANQSLILPIQQAYVAPYGEQTALLQNPFSGFCTVGNFMAGPGQQILCNQPAVVTGISNGIVTSYGPANNYYLWRFVASYSTSGAESVAETEYNWTGPNHPFGSEGFGGPNGPSSGCITGDFNGDGLTDFACPDGSGGFNVYFSTGAGFTAPSDWPTGDTGSAFSCGTGDFISCRTGDFNGDGKTDIIYYPGSGSQFHVYLSTGSGFQPYQTWNIPNLPPLQNPGNLSPPEGGDLGIFSSICTTPDLDGDGKTDLLCYANNSSNPGQWIYGLSTGSGFAVNTLNSVTPPSYFYEFPGNKGEGVMTSAIPFYASCLLGNFMGNGIPDILCNPDSFYQTTPVESYYSVGIISRQ